MNRRGESTQISTPLDAMDSSTGALEFRDNNNGGGGEAHSSPCRIVYFFSPILQPRLNRFFFFHTATIRRQPDRNPFLSFLCH